jgi:hypothetical protein
MFNGTRVTLAASAMAIFRQSPNYARSNAAARKAMALDPTLAHPHSVYDASYMEYEWDFAAGIAELKNALDPNSLRTLVVWIDVVLDHLAQTANPLPDNPSTELP